jgi:hypothetical protein
MGGRSLRTTSGPRAKSRTSSKRGCDSFPAWPASRLARARPLCERRRKPGVQSCCETSRASQVKHQAEVRKQRAALPLRNLGRGARRMKWTWLPSVLEQKLIDAEKERLAEEKAREDAEKVPPTCLHARVPATGQPTGRPRRWTRARSRARPARRPPLTRRRRRRLGERTARGAGAEAVMSREGAAGTMTQVMAAGAAAAAAAAMTTTRTARTRLGGCPSRRAASRVPSARVSRAAAGCDPFEAMSLETF